MKKIAYIILTIIVLVLGFVIYSISASDSSEDIVRKTKSEILYFESKFVYMFNSLNNIEYQNYKLSVEEISEKSKKSSESSSSAGNGDDSSGGSSQEESSSGGEGESESGGGDAKSKSDEKSSAKDTKKFSLNTKGILSSEKEINWDYIKNEAEILQNSIPTLTLDLFQINLNNNDIINFSKEFDSLLINLKNEDKKESLKQLVILYSYIPKFIKNCNIEDKEEILYSTKYSIFKAYSILDDEKWEDILKFIQEANNKFSKLLTDVNMQNDNQYEINKCYISINDFQNAANIKDKEIFLIKYRNLLEDLNNL